MRSQEAVNIFANAAPGTSAQFELHGGTYQLSVAATGSGGTVTLSQLGPDGATFIPCASSSTALTAAGTQLYDLPPGQYKLVVGTLTAVYAIICRVPKE
jgi:hypothetical protein